MRKRLKTTQPVYLLKREHWAWRKLVSAFWSRNLVKRFFTCSFTLKYINHRPLMYHFHILCAAYRDIHKNFIHIILKWTTKCRYFSYFRRNPIPTRSNPIYSGVYFAQFSSSCLMNAEPSSFSCPKFCLLARFRLLHFFIA